jgi:membrane-associated protease RseP (regulator of RpoE activity)
MEVRMSSRSVILLAVGMLIVGLLLGAVVGGGAGFIAGQNARAFPGQSLSGFTQPSGQMPFGPRGFAQSPNAMTGNRVDSVVADSPAATAGLQVGDVITAVAGTKIDANNTLASLVQTHKPGDKVDLNVTRGSQNLTITVTLGASPQNTSAAYLGITFSPMFPGRGRSNLPSG